MTLHDFIFYRLMETALGISFVGVVAILLVILDRRK